MKRLSSLLLVLFLGCSSGLTEAPEADPDARALLPSHDVGFLVTESASALDAAAIESILPGTHRRTTITGLGIDTDTQLRRIVDSSGREHFFTLQDTQGAVVERNRQGSALARFDVFEPGEPPARANPLDIAIDSADRLWITRHAKTSLLVTKLDGTRVASVDLKAFADDDGVPDMSAIAIVDHTAYVALRRLQGGFDTTKNTSTVVAIDTETLAVRPYVELPAKDPGAKFRMYQGALYISCIGGPLLDPPDRSAGLVRIDLSNATATKMLDADTAGGFVTAFDFVDTQGYAVVAEFSTDNPTKLVRFNLATGKVDEPWARTTGYRFWDVKVIRGGEWLLLGDRSPDAPGLRVLSTTDGFYKGKIPTRLPPVEMLVLYSDS